VPAFRYQQVGDYRERSRPLHASKTLDFQEVGIAEDRRTLVRTYVALQRYSAGMDFVQYLLTNILQQISAPIGHTFLMAKLSAA
jgi:hypothetical protein